MKKKPVAKNKAKSSALYHPNQPDTYAQRLAEVNQSNEVYATEDIHNVKGVLVLPKGRPVLPSVALKLLDHKLTKPLESSIHVENTVTGDALYEKCQEIYFSHSDTDRIYACSNIDQDLKHLCSLLDKHNLLKQKLTVMALQIEQEYDNAVFCAVLTAIIAKEMKKDAKSEACAFFAALFHDVGILHLEPRILDKPAVLSPADWKMYKGHPSISSHILHKLANLPKEAGDAALQHHERCDGTGYPFGKSEPQLTHLGQLVALSDTLTAIYFNRLITDDRNLHSTLPFLHLNQETYFYDNYQATYNLIKEADLLDKLRINNDNVASINASILEEMSRLLQWSKHTGDLRPILESLDPDPEVKGILHQIDVIWDSLRQSGLLSEGLNQWIENVTENKIEDAYEEMDEISLMQDELLWQYKNLHRRLAAFLNSPGLQPPHIIELMKKIHLLMTNLDNDNNEFITDVNLDIRTIIGSKRSA